MITTIRAHRHSLATVTENVRVPVREARNRRRALAAEDEQLIAQIERRRAEDERKKALMLAGLRRQAMGR